MLRLRSLARTGAFALLLFGTSCRASAQSAEGSHLRSRPGRAVEKAEPGLSRLTTAGGREAMLYVPSGYQANRAVPLLVLLHGATQSSELWTRSTELFRLADEKGIVLLMPNSVSNSWDLMRGGYGPDVIRLDTALAQVFRRCSIDPARVALGGFSDGATYALSLGVANGDLFSYLIAFSPGFFAPEGTHGKPRIFITHGTADRILPIDQTSRQITPMLKQNGYDLTYQEFEGGHTIRPEHMRGALEWFLAGGSKGPHR
jgi:phospholipase/carboxylesterase